MITTNKAIEIIRKELYSRDTLIIGIDGRCASGKTSLAAELLKYFPCNVIHIDDFFLRPEQRTQARLDTPGGNFDRERFTDEIINGLKSGGEFYYRKFDCSRMCLGDRVLVSPKPLTVIEGSYSCHPDVSRLYDLSFFMTTDSITQKQRIEARNTYKAEAFFSRWIPMEERYFEHFGIENNCNYIIKT